MFRTFLLMLFLCGLAAFSVMLSYRARAETSLCPSPPRPRVCVPEIPKCEVLPVPRACEKKEKLNSVSRVSTLDLLRAMRR